MENNIFLIYIILFILFFIFITSLILHKFNYYKNKKNNYELRKIHAPSESVETFSDDFCNDPSYSDLISSKESNIDKPKTCAEKCNAKKDGEDIDSDALDVLQGQSSTVKTTKNIIKKKLRKFRYNDIDYEGVSNTDCYAMNDDFDNWCRYNYVPNDEYPLPDGYTLNNIGTQVILNGKDGDCPNENLSRAICDFNSIKEVSKINPAIIIPDEETNFLDDPKYNLEYNVFTDCMPLNDSATCNINNFKQNCAELLEINQKDAIPTEISGYDCNPGYYRSKCKKTVHFA
jgi:hypothetical protein